MSDLRGVQKAAVLFLHLPEEAATQVFASLTQREMKQLNQATKDVASLSLQEVDGILTNYLEELDACSPELKAGTHIVSKLASQRFGDEKAREILGDDCSLADTLADVDSRTLANLIRKEHPQTMALILAHLPPQRAAEVLYLLPPQGQADILRRLASIDSVTKEIIQLIEDALLTELRHMGKGADRKIGGINVVADILNNLDKSSEQDLLRQLEESDESLAEEVRGLMFVFDDLNRLDGRGIQILLKEIERDTLVLALKAADEDLKQKIFKNLSARAVEMILEDLEGRGPVRLSEVEKAQAEVVRVAMSLIANGTIEIGEGGEDEFV